jgi:hypothetical protein
MPDDHAGSLNARRSIGGRWLPGGGDIGPATQRRTEARRPMATSELTTAVPDLPRPQA